MTQQIIDLMVGLLIISSFSEMIFPKRKQEYMCGKLTLLNKQCGQNGHLKCNIQQEYQKRNTIIRKRKKSECNAVRKIVTRLWYQSTYDLISSRNKIVSPYISIFHDSSSHLKGHLLRDKSYM